MEKNAEPRTARIIGALIARARLLRGGMIALMLAVVVVDFLKPSAYSRFPWDGIPGFIAVFAFLGALLLIGIYKAIGYGLVYRPADYYASKARAESQEGPQ